MPAEEIHICPAKHLVLEHLQTKNLAFDRSLTPGQRDPCLHGGAGVAIAEPAMEAPSLYPADMPLLSVEIRDVAQRLLVTRIEILSPANKHGDGTRHYAARRLELMRTETHLLEIDLLRQGSRIQLTREPPPAAYFIYLSRRDRRPLTQVWPIALREPLPVVPVPLLPPDPDVPLDRQAAMRACFNLVGYERLMDYSSPPPQPEFSAQDTAWMEGILHAAGFRHTPHESR